MQNRIGCRAIAAALALGVTLGLPVCAHAFEASEAAREACTPDAFRLCSAYIPDADRVAACMQANVANLSPPCRAVFQPAQPAAVNTTDAPAPRTRKIRTSYERQHHRTYTREESTRRTDVSARRSWAGDGD